MDVVLLSRLRRLETMLMSDPDSRYAVYGVSWAKRENPSLVRVYASVDMVANAGVDSSTPRNDFDDALMYRDITDAIDTYGNVFRRVPKFYIRKVDGVGRRAWLISRHRYPGFYLPWCFWHFGEGRELPYVDIGKHKGSLSGDGKLESKPNTYPLVNTNIVDFRNYARANNVDGLQGYQQMDIHAWDMLQALFFVEFATLNSQAIMRGFTDGVYGSNAKATQAETGVNRIVVANAQAANFRVGQTIGIGSSATNFSVFYGRTITDITPLATDTAIEFDGDPVNIAENDIVQNIGWKAGFSSEIAASSGSIGSNSDGKFPMMYRGIESFWGDIFQWVDGLNLNGNQPWVCKDANQYESNVFASPYEQLAYQVAGLGYISQVGHDPELPFASLATSVAGGALDKYYCDRHYSSTTSQYVARFGGCWSVTGVAGVSCAYLNYTASSTNLGNGGRLLKKPL